MSKEIAYFMHSIILLQLKRDGGVCMNYNNWFLQRSWINSQSNVQKPFKFTSIWCWLRQCCAFTASHGQDLLFQTMPVSFNTAAAAAQGSRALFRAFDKIWWHSEDCALPLTTARSNVSKKLGTTNNQN